jgi:L,D-transpeptidase catalytic domain
MNLPRLLFVITICLFSTIGVLALFKKGSSVDVPDETPPVTEIALHPTVSAAPAVVIQKIDQKQPIQNTIVLPEADRIEEFFSVRDPKLPIVETITYKSHVPWLKGRPAWLSDYANHFATSRHFIARSLNGKADYFDQDIAEGDRFNVLRKDKNFTFHLLVDTSRCLMWFYYIDLDTNQTHLLKKYIVGLGRVDSSKASGILTPLGTYTLGDRVAIYKPKVMGNYLGKKKEMITIFGTRWIPFEKEVESCTLPAKGFGLHGTPWTVEGSSGELKDSSIGIGTFASDGCIRLRTRDIEELFAIIITKPTTIEIIPDIMESSFLQNTSQSL